MQSAIFRHPLAMEGLKTGLEGEEKSLLDAFQCWLEIRVRIRRGAKLTKTGNCLGYRPVVDGKPQNYKWFR